MEINKVLINLRNELEANTDERIQKSGKGFFKEEIKLYGIKTPLVVKIAKEHFKEIKNEPNSVIFGLCEEFWKSGYLEESVIACNWSYAIRKTFKPDDFAIFERWISNYVNNWASCDTLCNHTVGTFLEMYPEFLPELKKWAGSENRWLKRASAVSLIIPGRNGKFLTEIIEIAGILLKDQDDLVQKGYGWMLKAASNMHQKEIFDYVVNNKADMPRTALRYAIEKMPADLKTEAMKK
jgi:3-methyladenine DNA glycosylase AlkD